MSRYKYWADPEAEKICDAWLFKNLGEAFKNKKAHLKHPDINSNKIRTFFYYLGITPREFNISSINYLIMRGQTYDNLEDLKKYMDKTQYNLIKDHIDLTKFKTKEEKEIDNLRKRCRELEIENYNENKTKLKFRAALLTKGVIINKLQIENDELKEKYIKQTEEFNKQKEEIVNKITEIEEKLFDIKNSYTQ